MPLSTHERVTLITDDETNDLDDVGTLYIDENEFGFASEMVIETFSNAKNDQLRELELFFYGADEPFLPQYFTDRVGMAFGDFGGEEERVGATFASLCRSAPDPEDINPQLIVRVVMDVHKLVTKVRRQQPVVVRSGWGRSRFDFDHHVESGGSNVIPETRVGRVELTAVSFDDCEPARFESATLDAWLRADGRLVGGQSYFGVGRSADRDHTPFYVDDTGDVYACQDGGTRRIAWSNIMGRNLANREGCFLVLNSGRIIPMTASIDVRELNTDGRDPHRTGQVQERKRRRRTASR